LHEPAMSADDRSGLMETRPRVGVLPV
jgi:hypothetical protein